MGAALSQAFPPKPTFTEKEIPNQKGRIAIVTGASPGSVGFEVSAILHRAGAKVYIAGRSEETGKKAIAKIIEQSSSSENTGSLEFLHLDLADLSTIKSSAQAFQAKESKLDLLFNNAGVSLPPSGSTSAQGHELMLAVNCFGPYLFTQLLLPQLRAAAETPGTPAGSVRVIWTSSQVVELMAPKGGLIWSDLHTPAADQNRNYANSKTGNYYLASEFARRYGAESGGKILSVTNNPGALKTNLLRHKSAFFRLMVSPFLYPPVYGAYTELYSGLSDDLKLELHGGAYIIPWGRIHTGMREDILQALKDKEDGGTGQAKEFWEFCNEKTKEFM